ncbi:MAG: elongator complex protein 3 [Deltaproteobacteria bacterium]
MRHYNIPIFVPHQGCPFQCVYCDQKIIASQHEAPTVREVSETIERHLATIPPEDAEVEIAFFGGSFTAIARELQEAYLQAAAPYLEDQRVTGIRLSTRPDSIDQDILAFLDQYGVKTVELGVQSLDDQVLKMSARGYAAADVFKACQLVKDHGFNLGVQLMIGLPGDDRTRDMKTTELAIALGPDMVRIYPTVVIAGTFLEQALKKGEYVPLELGEAVTICKDMYLRFAAAGIRVIRMGLQTGEELRREGSVVAGPFHPSFGELVQQDIFCDQARSLLGDYMRRIGLQAELQLWVNPRDLSLLMGQYRRNITFLTDFFGMRSLMIKTRADMDRLAVGVSQPHSHEIEMLLERRDLLERIHDEP